MHLVNLLHGGLGSTLSSGGLLSLGLGLGLLVDVQAERNEFVDALSEAGGLVNGESRDEEGGLVEELGDRLDGAVVLAIGLDLVLELLDDRGLGGDLEGLLGGHVGGHGGVTERLGLHDTLHVSGPPELASTDGARRADELVGDDDLLDLVAEDVLEALGETLELLLLSLTLLLLIFGLLKLEVLGDVHELLAVELLELSHGILINWVNEEENLKALLLEGVKEGRLLDGVEGLASDVVHLLLVLGHAGDIVGEGGGLVTRLGGWEAEELGEGLAVLSILVDTELDVLAEGAVELVELLTVLGDLVEKLERLLHDVLLDDLHDLVLLEGLARQVERKVLRVDNTLDEAEPLGNEVGGIVSDEDAANVELDVVLGLLGLEQVEGSTLGDEEDSTELELTLNGEVLDGKVVLPVARGAKSATFKRSRRLNGDLLGQALVESTVFLLGDIGRVAGPDGLGLVEFLLLNLGLLDSLGLLLFLLLIIDLLDLGLLIVTLLLLGLLSILIGDLLLGLLQDVEVNGVGDELGVLLHNLLDAALVEVVELLVLEVEDHLGTTAKLLTRLIAGDGESTTGRRFPNVLLVIVVLGDDGNLVGNEVSRVESNTELTDHGDIGTSGEGLHKLLSSRAGNGTKVVDEVL